MKPKVSFMLVGAFVMIFGAAMVGGVVFLSAATGRVEHTTYVIYMTESVGGLSINANVRYNGVPVGRVSEIELDPADPARVRVELEIREGTPVKTDTVATLNSSGITGVAQVELSEGTAAAPMLTAVPPEEYPVIETKASLFVRLDESITGLVDELTGAATSLTNVADRVEMMLDQDNRDSISAILSNVETFTGELTDITAQVTRVATHVESAVEDLPRLVASAERTIGAFEEAALSLDEAGAGVSGTADALQASTSEVANNVNDLLVGLTPLSRGAPASLVHLVDELQLLASSLRSLTQDIQRNPEMLVFGRRNVVHGPGE